METMAPTSEVEGYVARFLPNYTVAALQNPESPQTQAMTWLVTEHAPEILRNYTTTRLHQRFALATLYFSTNGTQWKFQRY